MLVPDIIAKLSPVPIVMFYIRNRKFDFDVYETYYKKNGLLPRNSIESLPAELQAAQTKLPGATKFGFITSASSRELSSGSGPLAE